MAINSSAQSSRSTIIEAVEAVIPFLSGDGSKQVQEILSKVSPAISSDDKTITSNQEFQKDIDFLKIVSSIPFGKFFDYKTIDFPKVIKELGSSHYGLQKAKSALTEALFMRYKGFKSSDVICFVGPPGCGKTSLSNSYGKLLDIDCKSIALGGVSDEVVLRGMFRSYLSSRYGRPIDALKNSRYMNGVIILDEIDKLGEHHRGSAQAALLELLDPEQNSAFVDQYLGFPVDFSNITFLCTANYVERIPVELADRLKIVHVPGYSNEEQMKIMKDFLIPKYFKMWEISPETDFEEEAIGLLLSKEAKGVRTIESNLATALRSFLLKSELGDKIKLNADFIKSTLVSDDPIRNRRLIGFCREQ